MFFARASLSPPEAAALRVARVARCARCTCRTSALPLEERHHVVRVLQELPRRPKVRRPNKVPRRPQKALQKALPRVRRCQQGAMVVWQVSRCALWCHCRLLVMPVWFCCAFGIRPGLCCAFCACYALQVSRFLPSSARQHPIFRVVQAPVPLKEEPPRVPGTPCRTGKGSRYGDGCRGQDGGRRHPRLVEGWESWEGEDGWEGQGSEGFFFPLGEPSPEWPEPDESRGRQSSQPALRVPPWEFSAQIGSFSQQAGLVASHYVVELPVSWLYTTGLMEFYGDRTGSARSAPSTSELVVSRKKRYHSSCQLLYGRGIEVETPPLRCRLLCGRRSEAQTPPPKKKTPTLPCATRATCCL